MMFHYLSILEKQKSNQFDKENESKQSSHQKHIFAVYLYLKCQFYPKAKLIPLLIQAVIKNVFRDHVLELVTKVNDKVRILCKVKWCPKLSSSKAYSQTMLLSIN